MSLLDDVSIVVTPNGYKAGELYAVVPVPTEGSEEVTNGDFATDSDWNKGTGWAISGGKASNDGSQSGNSWLSQNSVLVVGKRYKATFNLIVSSGQIIIDAQSGATAYSSSGLITDNFVATTTTFQFMVNNSFIGSIDNVSVKEYTAADMDVTRATAATRVDEAGLVNYAEVVSDTELVSNGDFEIASGDVGGFWTTGAGWAILGNGLATRAATGTNFAVDRDSFLTINQTYKVVIVVQVVTSGNVKVVLGATNSPEFTAAGTYTFIGVQTNNTKLRISPSNDYVGSVSNISVKEVTRDNVPRIDYSGGGCPHILAEPQRTNLDTTSASGTYGSTPTSEISAIAPDGENTAIRPVPGDASNRYQYTLTGGTYSSGDVLTYSWYRKRFSTPTGSVVTGDLDIKILVNCTQVGVTTEIASSINGYDRFSATVSITDGSLSSILRFYFGNVIEVGNSSVAYWGHQLEQGSYATSYIPTDGSTVTRNQDQFTRDGIGSLINSTEGVLFVEMAALSNDGTDRRLSLSNGTVGNAINIGLSRFSGNINSEIYSGGVLQTSGWGASGVTQANSNKFALSWGSGTMKFYVNGSPTNTNTGITSPIGLNTLKFSDGVGALNLFAKVKQLQVYKTALTDTQLAALTS